MAYLLLIPITGTGRNTKGDHMEVPGLDLIYFAMLGAVGIVVIFMLRNY